MKRIFVILLLTLTLTSCTILNTPPSVESVEDKLLENFTDLQTVITFMVESGYEDIYIRRGSNTALADLKDITIKDQQVRESIDRLLENGEYKSISKRGNTIELVQWTGTQDIGCGVAYSIDGIALPKIQFVTELIPLSVDGWYYYVDDYNLWRTGKRPSEPTTPKSAGGYI